MTQRIAEVAMPEGWVWRELAPLRHFGAGDWAYVLGATTGANLAEPDEIASAAMGFVQARLRPRTPLADLLTEAWSAGGVGLRPSGAGDELFAAP